MTTNPYAEAVEAAEWTFAEGQDCPHGEPAPCYECQRLARRAVAAAVGPLLAPVRALADEWRYKGEHGWGPWQAGEGPDPEGWVLDHAAYALTQALDAIEAGATSEGARDE